jgi:hypothetical protein
MQNFLRLTTYKTYRRFVNLTKAILGLVLLVLKLLMDTY